MPQISPFNWIFVLLLTFISFLLITVTIYIVCFVSISDEELHATNYNEDYLFILI